MVVTSKEFWVSLPDDIRPIVSQSLNEAIAHGNLVAAERTRSDRQAIIDSGISEVISISAEQRQQWVTAMKPVWKEYEQEIGKELIQAALSANQ